MTAVAQAFEKFDGRDDLAMLRTVKFLPGILAGIVESPADGATDLALQLDEGGVREEVRSKLTILHSALRFAIHESADPRLSCERLRQELGSRLPNQPAQVAISTVRSTAPQKVKVAPVVGTQISG